MKNIFALVASIVILSCGKKEPIIPEEKTLNTGKFLKWRSEKMLVDVILYKKDNGKLSLKFTYKNGKVTEDEVVELKSNGFTKYQDANEPAEYYLLESNGNLGMYAESIKYDEAIKIE